MPDRPVAGVVNRYVHAQHIRDVGELHLIQPGTDLPPRLTSQAL
jgi:hypothetical protein